LDFAAPGSFQHVMGGQHSISGADCPNCEKPLLRFLSLDTTDERLGLRGLDAPHLPLLYCWPCGISEEEFFYRVKKDGSVELVASGYGPPSDRYPYEGYPDHFPMRRVELRAIPDGDQELVRAINRSSYSPFSAAHEHLRSARHQIGGEAFLWQPLREDLTCPDCSLEMLFLATICDNAVGPDVRKGYREEVSFTKNLGVQVVYHYCRDCSVVGAYQMCD